MRKKSRRTLQSYPLFRRPSGANFFKRTFHSLHLESQNDAQMHRYLLGVRYHEGLPVAFGRSPSL